MDPEKAMASMSRVWIGALVGLVVLNGASPAVGQTPRAPDVSEGPMLGFGFVANAPHAPVGGAVWGLIPGLNGFGLYADFKTSVGSAEGNDNFVPGLTPEEIAVQYDHLLFDREDHYWGINVAVTRAITEELIVYLGGGYGQRTRYQEYWDEERQVGEFGYYWVEDPERSGDYVNLLGGVFFRISSRVRIQFGAEAQPAGFTVGLSYNVPAR